MLHRQGQVDLLKVGPYAQDIIGWVKQPARDFVGMYLSDHLFTTHLPWINMVVQQVFR